MRKKGFIVKKMDEDGACLFRAVADQVYGDQEMHGVVRKHCMDYIVSYDTTCYMFTIAAGNSNFVIILLRLDMTERRLFQASNKEFFRNFVAAEDFSNYVNRKRLEYVHGNHIEMHAMSEMYNRSIQLYCYSTGMCSYSHLLVSKFPHGKKRLD